MKQTKRKSLLGLPVIILPAGKVVGVVEDVVYDAREGVVTSIVVAVTGEGDGSGPLGIGAGLPAGRGRTAIPITIVKSAGEDAVTIVDSGRPAAAANSASRGVDGAGSPRLIGMPVMTDGGKALGRIEDIVFDLETGCLSGFELSDGLIQDFVAGRTVLPVPEIYALGRDAVIVPVPVPGSASGPASAATLAPASAGTQTGESQEADHREENRDKSQEVR